MLGDCTFMIILSAILLTAQLNYGAVNSGQRQELSFDATPTPGDFASLLSVYRKVNGSAILLWQGSWPGERIAAAIPFRIPSASQEGFLFTTKGIAGNRFRTILVVTKADAKKGSIILNEVGRGEPYFPDIMWHGKNGDPVLFIRVWPGFALKKFDWSRKAGKYVANPPIKRS